MERNVCQANHDANVYFPTDFFQPNWTMRKNAPINTNVATATAHNGSTTGSSMLENSAVDSSTLPSSSIPVSALAFPNITCSKTEKSNYKEPPLRSHHTTENGSATEESNASVLSISSSNNVYMNDDYSYNKKDCAVGQNIVDMLSGRQQRGTGSLPNHRTHPREDQEKRYVVNSTTTSSTLEQVTKRLKEAIHDKLSDSSTMSHLYLLLQYNKLLQKVNHLSRKLNFCLFAVITMEKSTVGMPTAAEGK